MKRLLLILSVIGSFLYGRANLFVEEDDSVYSSLPDLNVTAIKQSGNLSRQALSFSIVDQQTVQRNNIFDIKSLSDLVPNFYMPVYGSRITSTIYVRGLGARMDQPVVGLNVDNLTVLNKDAYDFDIPDIEAVEMIRGPQSSLYGRNTMAGLIHIRTVSPMKWQGLRLGGELFSGMSFKIFGGWYHKFNPKNAMSVSLGLNSIKGRYKNEYNGQPVGTEKSGNIRIKYEGFPTESVSLLNIFSTSLLHQSGYAYEFIETGKINYNDTCFYHRFLINDAFTAKFSFPGWTLSSITSLQHGDDNMTLDQDFLPVSYFTLTQKKNETALTEEVLAQSHNSHPYQWLAGFFGFYRHIKMEAPVEFKDVGISELIESHRNQSNTYYPIKWDTRNFLLNSDFILPSFGLALFHESKYSVGDWLFSGQLRLDYERVKMRFHSYTNTGYTIYYNPSGKISTPFEEMEVYRHIPIDIDDTGDISMHYLTLLPKFSVLYTLPDQLGNLYLTVGKGYKAGGFNTNMFSDVLQQKLMSIMGVGAAYDVEQIVKYKPEYSWNYEIGTHLDFSSLGSRLADLSLDLSLFYIDCRDQQLTMFPDGTTTGRVMTNAGKTRSFGLETTLRYSPWNPLRFLATYGFTNARFVKFFDGIEDYKGKHLPYAPAHTFFAQALYNLDLKKTDDLRLVFDLNLRGTGSIYWNESNTLKQPFYALLGAGVTLKALKWEVELWGRNLTSTKYKTFYFMSMGHEFLQRGEKTTFGVSLRLFI